MANMNKVVMRYGSSENTGSKGYPKLVAIGDLEYDETEDIDETELPLDEGGVYYLIARGYNKTTDAASGHSTRQITVPVGSEFGNSQSQILSVATGGGSALSITANSDSTVTIKPYGVNIHLRYALYRMA